MTCFSSISNCCLPPPPPPPEEECCISLSDIEDLFPSGAYLGVLGNAISISNTGWEIVGCCAFKTQAVNITPSFFCTSDWDYIASQTLKCETTAARLKLKYVSMNFEEVTCSLNECPDIILGARTMNSVEEKAERVVLSSLTINSVTLSIGKFLRTCTSGGTPECVYVVGVSVTFDVGVGSYTRFYKHSTKALEYLDPGLLACCTASSVPPPTFEDYQAIWAEEETVGEDDFPVCPTITPGPVGSVQQINISRVKILTNPTGPLTFGKDDPAPDFCDVPEFCVSPVNSSTDKVTVTFNRTLPPVYEEKSFSSSPGVERCCVNRVINTKPNPDEAYDIYGPNLWTTSGVSSLLPPSPGTSHLSSPFIFACFTFGTSCICGIPDGVSWQWGFQCCAYPTLPIIWPNYEAAGETKYSNSFSYVANTDNTPIVHEHPIGPWTLTF